MIKAEKRITRSIRLPLDVDKTIRKAARHSRGTASQNDVIVRLLRSGIKSEALRQETRTIIDIDS